MVTGGKMMKKTVLQIGEKKGVGGEKQVFILLFVPNLKQRVNK